MEQQSVYDGFETQHIIIFETADEIVNILKEIKEHESPSNAMNLFSCQFDLTQFLYSKTLKISPETDPFEFFNQNKFTVSFEDENFVNVVELTVNKKKEQITLKEIGDESGKIKIALSENLS